jgi:hypothetical protein
LPLLVGDAGESARVHRRTADIVDQNVDPSAARRHGDQLLGGTWPSQVHLHERHLPRLHERRQPLAAGARSADHMRSGLDEGPW